jgi:hypothetical protein
MSVALVLDMSQQLMSTSGAKNTLEVVTNVAVLLAATAFLAALSWGFFIRQQAPSAGSGFRKGAPVPVLPNVNYAGASKTLLIAMNTRCHFCTASIPFYNSLVERHPGTRMLAVFPNDEGEVKEYARQQRLRLEAVGGVDFRALQIESTPTMILIGGDGKILDFWIGKLSEANEVRVTAAVDPS